MSGGQAARRAGRWGEAVTAEYLRRAGYMILETGYRCRMGEIDLIARKDGILAFVEVKTRRSGAFAAPREFVDARKQRRLRLTAQAYLAAHPECALQPRFDVAEVLAPEGPAGEARVTYLENAFW